jgi:hypothetical protein|tara:strand:- start:2035 stop:2808 length:774 start_codon:yes stop_codon:yes gene_type:complete
MNYRTQLQTITDLGLAPGESHRGECPFCGRWNTFNASNDGRSLQWYCYHVDCEAKGIKGAGLTEDSFKGLTTDTELDIIAYELPNWFVEPERELRAMSHLKSVNALPAYKDGLIRVRYDLQQDRLVYLTRHDGVVVGGVGRTLRGQKPKWYKYGYTSEGLLVSSHTRSGHVVVVEDAPSAAVVATTWNQDGFALLGTGMTQEMLEILRGGYGQVTVALDKDATRKALELVTYLKFFIPNTRLMMLEEDIKDGGLEQR